MPIQLMHFSLALIISAILKMCGGFCGNRAGTAIISGCCAINEKIFPPVKMQTKCPVLAPGVSFNSLLAFDSMLKIEGLADIIILSHEIELAERTQIPYTCNKPHVL